MAILKNYTELVVEADKRATIVGETRGDMIALLSAPYIGTIEEDWDE